jgi:predicted RNA binding protein YcfA (HicA-like mRNA interferase family)
LSPYEQAAQVSGAEVVKALLRKGFTVRRQHGSHIILRRNDPFSQTVVPNHKQIDRGTLRAILRQAGVDVDEFISLIA